MREFFIGALDKLIGVVAVLLSLGVLVISVLAMTSGSPVPGGPNGFLGGLLILIFGTIYVIFVVGFMYLGLGIYQNTKRTAAALEAQRGG